LAEAIDSFIEQFGHITYYTIFQQIAQTEHWVASLVNGRSVNPIAHLGETRGGQQVRGVRGSFGRTINAALMSLVFLPKAAQ
jgi:hypothetical protein